MKDTGRVVNSVKMSEDKKAGVSILTAYLMSVETSRVVVIAIRVLIGREGFRG